MQHNKVSIYHYNIYLYIRHDMKYNIFILVISVSNNEIQRHCFWNNEYWDKIINSLLLHYQCKILTLLYFYEIAIELFNEFYIIINILNSKTT